MIDGTDHKILAILSENCRTSNAEIGRRIDLAPSAVLERIRKLEASGIIRSYNAVIDAPALGLGVLAFVFVGTDGNPGEAAAGDHLAKIPGVQEVHHICGEDCFLVKVRARTTQELGHLLQERFRSIPSVKTTRTVIVLDTMKECGRVPIGPGDPGDDAAATPSTSSTTSSSSLPTTAKSPANGGSRA